VLLLTRSAGYAYLSRALVVEITTHVRHIPVEVPLGRAEGVARPSVANFDSIHVVPLASLTKRIGALAPRRLTEAKRALGYVLDWSELKHAGLDGR
jgi:mRNA-degrading endonuclease toxin of MazEF toxin-antitoxin module